MSVFRLKQFDLIQKQSAMKLGTDALLFGAWVDLNGFHSVLDIGTGTGILALMCTQRSDSLSVHAIDIDVNAVHEAEQNFSKSPWMRRLSVKHAKAQNVSSSRYDLVISNPPFFDGGPDIQKRERKMARNSESLTLKELFDAFVRLKTENGALAFIYPISAFSECQELVRAYTLSINRLCFIRPNPNKAVHRFMIQISEKPFCSMEGLIIETNRHTYHHSSHRLLQDFLLNPKLG